jgi:hypothetical protein
MITGTAGKCISDDRETLSDFVRISMTEECKLLPASGIYAVSVEAGSSYSKGMAIITRGEDNASDVLISIFDNLIIHPDQQISSFFHKKIHGAVNLADSKSKNKITLAKEEILELIY